MQNKFEGQALNLNVIVEEVDNENITASGLDLTGIVDANEKQKKGRVVSVGTECPSISYKFKGLFSFINFFIRKQKQTIQVGNTVIFDKFKMTLFTQKGKQYIMIDYRDLVWVG